MLAAFGDNKDAAPLETTLLLLLSLVVAMVLLRKPPPPFKSSSSSSSSSLSKKASKSLRAAAVAFDDAPSCALEAADRGDFILTTVSALFPFTSNDEEEVDVDFLVDVAPPSSSSSQLDNTPASDAKASSSSSCKNRYEHEEECKVIEEGR